MTGSKKRPICRGRKKEAPSGDGEEGISKVLSLLFGSPCGEPAVYLTRLGTPVCEACGLAQRKAHREGTTLFSMLVEREHGPEALDDFPLTPIQ